MRMGKRAGEVSRTEWDDLREEPNRGARMSDRSNGRVTAGTICAGIWLFALTFALAVAAVWGIVAVLGGRR